MEGRKIFTMDANRLVDVLQQSKKGVVMFVHDDKQPDQLVIVPTESNGIFELDSPIILNRDGNVKPKP